MLGETRSGAVAHSPSHSPQPNVILQHFSPPNPTAPHSDPGEFTPSPGKRTDKINVAAGLSASKGSKGSHKKKKIDVHHLEPPGQPRIDFSRLVQEHGR